MPPSTVFSYWRRDHRRSTAPPASLSAPLPRLPSTDDSPLSPPQLPEIPDTLALSSALDSTASYDALPWFDSPLESDNSKLNFTSSAAPLSSSVSLAVPSPAVEKANRPHSSPEEISPEPHFTAQANNSQLSVNGSRLDQGDGDSQSKPTSPFRLSIGKGVRGFQTSSFENAKRSPTAGPGASHVRLKPPPEDGSNEKPVISQRETKPDGTMPRRIVEREVSAENVHHKSGKAMLHLLNPMSLLARRRSSQMSSSRVEDVKINAPNLIPAIPDDYDPRIRGNIVHDFSAPRPRRNLSGNLSGDGSTSNAQDSSLQHPANRWSDNSKRNSDHSPAFKEHFEDDEKVLQVENKGYLHSSLLTNPTQSGYEKSIPVFARKFPSTAPEHSPEAGDEYGNLPAELPADVPVELPAEVPSEYSTSPPKESPPASQRDQDVIPKVYPAGLPKHLKSNASSRFSFDMGGVESSVQEKLLEEKHKAKEAARKLEDGYFDDFDDDFDNDMLDDMDDLEETIPELNADYDEYEDIAPAPLRNVNGDLKSWAAPGLSPVVASPITPAPPHEIPMSALSADEPESVDSNPYFNSEEMNKPEENPVVSPLDKEPSVGVQAISENTAQVPQNDQPNMPIGGDDEDDLYFDDGQFGDEFAEELALAAQSVDSQGQGFDESIFDDVTSHLYERKPVKKEPEQASSQKEDLSDNERLDKEISLEEDASQGLKHMPSVASEYAPFKRGPLGEPIPNLGPARAHGGVLTEQNLDILHNALAFAASESVGQGPFGRTFSTSERSLAQESISQTSHTGDSQPGLVSDDSRVSQGAEMIGFDDVFDDHIYDDDPYYDDPIVAAANAEALENDDEGFYGQEFGFYAQAHGSSNSTEMTNGGYFGPRGVEGITRSFSSRGKFQEPSLTPITERSEWSTRNSMISVKAHGASLSNASLASPGLAQLVDMGSLDDEMTLSALMKLRRGAWGGSNGSLRSSAGSPPPHTLTSSHRGSFTGPSEAASPSDARSSADEGLASLSYHPDDRSHTAPPLRDSGRGLGQPADLPHLGIDGPIRADGEEELPNIGSNQVLNVL
ncbi:hypothetical protein N7478_008486 [Penicillium angulare]|uniref:uncharacterized protein n=1 Tax=Penicillium angulare TaxID=116970 RepID=UPI002541B323|nr:uncharacterized protein N7478_008486 [Penicillium angulare]KAJ5273361.1 hypothetical protein N7478_008486 [Penicillium angulare]